MLNIKRFALLVALFLLALPAFALDDELTVVGGDDAALRQFIQVYLRDMSPPDTHTTIYIGEQPTTTAVEIPMDSVDQLVGAIVREGTYPSTEWIYTTSKSVSDVEAFYETEMENLGWEALGMNYGQRGFIAQEQSYRDFCNADKDMALNVNIRMINDSTLVRINLNEQPDGYYCNQPDMSEAYNNDPYLRLPELSTPEGVTVMFNRGGGGGGGGYPGTQFSSTSTWLETTLSLTDLMEAYNVQLVANGWEQVEGETGEQIALTLWQFSDDDGGQWNGYFSVMGNASQNGQYYATIMVEQVEE